MSCDPAAYLGSRMFMMKHWFACISYTIYVCRLEHTDTVSQQRYYILNLTKSGYVTMLWLTPPQPGNVGAGYNVQTVSRWRWSHTLRRATASFMICVISRIWLIDCAAAAAPWDGWRTNWRILKNLHGAEDDTYEDDMKMVSGEIARVGATLTLLEHSSWRGNLLGLWSMNHHW